MVPASRSLIAGALPRYGTSRHLEAALEHHQLAEQMPGVGLALVAVSDLAGIGLGVVDELLEVVRRQILARNDDQRIGREHADRLERPRIERRLGEHQMRDAVAELRRAQERVAVRRRAQHLLHADAAAGAAGPVLDHHLLAEHCGRLLGGVAAEQIRRAAGRQRHHHGDVPRRKRALRLRGAADQGAERHTENRAGGRTLQHGRSPLQSFSVACWQHSGSALALPAWRACDTALRYWRALTSRRTAPARSCS